MRTALAVLVANIPTMFFAGLAGALAQAGVTAWAWGPLLGLAIITAHAAKSSTTDDKETTDGDRTGSQIHR